MLQKIRWFLVIVGVLVVVVIAIQNDQPVLLKLLFFQDTLPLTLLVLVTSAASFVLGALTTFWMLRSSARKTAPAVSATRKPSKTSDRNPLTGAKSEA